MKKQNLLILLLAVVALCAIALSLWAIFFRTPALAPDQAPQPEANGETIPGDPGEKLPAPEGGGSVSLSFSREVTVDLSSEKISLVFANPGKSNQDLVLQLVIQDVVVMQTGTLIPGTQVTEMDLLPGTARQLSPGTYEAAFHVLLYLPESGEKAMVDTQIPVTVTVS